MLSIYGLDKRNVEEILSFHDVFDGNVPNLKTEIQKLNMHKTISIICELINAMDYEIEHKGPFFEIKIPFETALKRIFFEKTIEPAKFFTNPLVQKKKHIIALQTLLVLLKKVIIYGDYTTLANAEYKIDIGDYKNIIVLHLIVAEELDQKFDDSVDMNHFIYANYHLNYDRNVANHFLRSYYMFENVSQNRDNFDKDVRSEYKDYYQDFTCKYGYTPTQYLSLLFWELSVCYTTKNNLSYQSLWRSAEAIYANTAMKDVGIAVISDLSQAIIAYQSWAIETENSLWDFSKFIEQPFLSDAQGKYISICEYTLKNTFFEKLYWQIRNCYPQRDSRAMDFYGRLFEKYVQTLTENAIANVDTLLFIPEFTYRDNEKSSDAYIRKQDKLLAIESKGFSILLRSFVANEDIEKNNNKLFIDPILQADKAFSKIDEIGGYFDGIQTVYIISVTMDNVNAVPDYMNKIYKTVDENKKSQKIKYIFNLNIEEYEMLMFLAENGIDIFEVLADYSESLNISPFSTYLNENENGKIKMTKFMDATYKEASSAMLSMYNLHDE